MALMLTLYSLAPYIVPLAIFASFIFFFTLIFRELSGLQFKAAFHSLKQCTKLEYHGFAPWRNDREEQLYRPAMMFFITHL